MGKFDVFQEVIIREKGFVAIRLRTVKAMDLEDVILQLPLTREDRITICAFNGMKVLQMLFQGRFDSENERAVLATQGVKVIQMLFQARHNMENERAVLATNSMKVIQMLFQGRFDSENERTVLATKGMSRINMIIQRGPIYEGQATNFAKGVNRHIVRSAQIFMRKRIWATNFTWKEMKSLKMFLGVERRMRNHFAVLALTSMLNPFVRFEVGRTPKGNLRT